jgi:hypothetical protein
MEKPLVSVIIRTRNEEKWIESCLRAVYRQEYDHFEVILVDNKSTDKTLSIIQNFPAKLIEIDQFLPGKALNLGIREAQGEIMVCLSGHCIPKNQFWLSNLVRNFDDPHVAGVYGRQEPLPYSSDLDKRDLITVFGLDRKIQKKDSFFHNANSAIRKKVWDAFPFCEQTTNLEDRLWAKEILQENYILIYEPEASVFHWHGIHQNADEQRARQVVRILESLELMGSFSGDNPIGLNIVGIIPIKGESPPMGKKDLLSYTIAAAQHSKLLKDVFVATDSRITADRACSLGAKAPFLRPPDLSYEHIGLEAVIQFFVEKLDETGITPDVVVILQEAFPFRPPDLIDLLIKEMLYKKVNTLVPVFAEKRACFRKEGQNILIMEPGIIPKKFKDPVFVNLSGLGLVVDARTVKAGLLYGPKLGIFPITNSISQIQISSPEECDFFRTPIEDFWKKEYGKLDINPR